MNSEAVVDPVAPEAPHAEPEKKKRKKKFSSKGLKELDKLDRSVSKASRRLARAVQRGVRDWEKNREKSARKKKDGAMVYAVENVARAAGTFLRTASGIPADLASFRPKGLRVPFMPPFRR